MPVDIASVGVLAALILPVYGALWRISHQIGTLNVQTDSNSEDFDSLADVAESNRRRIRDIEGKLPD
jgi:fumarate reductase subunit D